MVKFWAQEPLMKKRLHEHRSAELLVTQAVTWTSTLLNSLMRVAPTLISASAFIAAVLASRLIGSAQIFPSFLFCSLLVRPLSLLPNLLLSWGACISSCTRLQANCEAQDAVYNNIYINYPSGIRKPQPVNLNETPFHLLVTVQKLLEVNNISYQLT
jgi:hypothetical protein